MADIEMNAFKILTNATYIYGEASDSSQVKIKKEDFMTSSGVCRLYIDIEPGGLYELPLNSGLIIIRDATMTYGIACAIIEADNKGKILAADQRIIFFSEAANKICVFKSGKYKIKNTYAAKHTVSVFLIGEYTSA